MLQAHLIKTALLSKYQPQVAASLPKITDILALFQPVNQLF